jgi:hypothetical protein
LVYIKYLTINIQDAKQVIYADNTNILVTDNDKENLQAKPSSVMKQLEAWFFNNDLIVVTTKTATMSFHLCPSKPPYKPNILLQNTEITYTSEVKILGMCITENLNWRAHIRYLCHNLSKTYCMIKPLKITLSTHMLWGIYYAHFQSRLRYGIILWGGSNKC